MWAEIWVTRSGLCLCRSQELSYFGRLQSYPFSSHLSRETIRSLIFYALRVWAEPTPLEFHEVCQMPASVSMMLDRRCCPVGAVTSTQPSVAHDFPSFCSILTVSRWAIQMQQTCRWSSSVVTMVMAIPLMGRVEQSAMLSSPQIQPGQVEFIWMQRKSGRSGSQVD